MSSMDSHLSLPPPVLELQTHIPVPGFSMGFEDPNRAPHVCVASTLLIGTSPQSL